MPSPSLLLLLAAAATATALLLTPTPQLRLTAPSPSTTRPGHGPSMGLLGRFRKKRKVEAAPQITVGTALPEIDVELVPDVDTLTAIATADGDTDVPSVSIPIGEALGEGTSILVGMPGAFTPTCSDQHLPGYIKQAPALKKLGVNKVAVVTTNDRFVNDAWNKAISVCVGKASNLTMLSDGDGDLSKALGLVEDMGYGIGVRSKRFALLCEDGVVRHVAVDEGMDTLSATSATSMMRVIDPSSVPAEDEQSSQIGVALGAVLVLIALVLFSSQGDGGSSVIAAKSVGGYQSIPSSF